MAPRLTLTVLGTGAGATAVYSGEPSSAFVLSVNGTPVLLADVGLGTVQQCVRLVGSLPACVYVSHNHTDHAGELPVLLAVEAARAATKHVYAHPDVARRLQQHRLHELHSTGKSMDELAAWVACPEGQDVPLQGEGRDVTLRAVRSRHSELCFGAVVSCQGRPVLGWTADSGWDEGLFRELRQAPVLLVDARSKGTAEHAGFDDVARLARQELVPAGKRVLITGYGCQHEAPPAHMDLGGAEVVRPGQQIDLTWDPVTAVEPAGPQPLALVHA